MNNAGSKKMNKDRSKNNIEWLDFCALGEKMEALERAYELAANDTSSMEGHELRSPDRQFLRDIMLSMGVVCESKAFNSILTKASDQANLSAPLLISGDPGVGKKTLAKLIHHLGERRANGCLVLDCRELFQTIGRSFVPRVYLRQIKGSGRAIVVVDHPESLPLDMRNSLLSSLLEQPDLRLIFVVDRSSLRSFCNFLPQSMAQTLCDGQIAVPNLTERREDIRPFILSKLRRLNDHFHGHKRLSASALEHLIARDYRRNFFDLDHLLDQLYATQPDVIMFDGTAREPAADLDGPWLPPRIGNGFSLDDFLRGIRERIIWHALESAGYNQSRAAKLIGLSPQAINKFLRDQKSR